MQCGSVSYMQNTQCVCNCIRYTSKFRHMMSTLFLQMGLCNQSPPLLLQGFLLRPLDASLQPIFARRHAHIAGWRFHTLSFDSRARFLFNCHSALKPRIQACKDCLIMMM